VSKGWGNLPSETTKTINLLAERYVKEDGEEGDTRIAQTNQKREKNGAPTLTDEPLASYARWPVDIEQAATLQMGRHFEHLCTPPGDKLSLVQSAPTSTFQVERIRSTRERLLGLLQAVGITGKDAERELHRWVPSSYAAATVLFVDQGQGHQVLIELRNQDRDGTLTISFPEEQVRPGETLEEAARRGLGEQPIQFLHKEGLICAPFGPHHTQPAHLTFVVVATATGGKRIAPGTSPYGGKRRFISTDAMYLAIMQNQMAALARELGTERVVIPENVVNPARYHFQSWISSHLVVPQT
jgi:ADP-ribose pyrophosphatase YjhB (NUDIX family)